MGNESDGFPIQLAKVQPPPLRDATLERPRLLDWLRAKSHGRVVLLIADAGYGKTTLLADFARRVRSRTLWYRLDTDDRDWTSVLHHLVAAGRQHDPAFAPETVALLARIGIDGPQRDVVLDAFIGELPGIVREGTVLILDDLHLVDDAEDTRHILRELVARAPERLTFAIASRRTPPIPMARLRATGEVAELMTDDLRFDSDETSRLFRETYGRPIEEDVLADLTRRTEGWIASLQMVQAALRDRSPVEIRRFVQTMHGADQELYDYLAEEVVGDLAEELQRFLMETSILQLITPELAEIVTGLKKSAFQGFIDEAEQMTLLGRVSRSRRSERRYHPLVREFLEGRLRGLDDGVTATALHRRVAQATAATDWRLSAHHFREAGDLDAMGEVIVRALPTIMGDGQYAIAASFVADLAADRRPIGLALVTSRVDMQRGDYAAAITSSQAVLDASEDDPVQRDHALLNLIAAHFNRGDPEAHDVAERLASSATTAETREIARAALMLVDASSDGGLDELGRHLRSMSDRQRGNQSQYFGVTMLNLAGVDLLQDQLQAALAGATDALAALESTSGMVERWAAVANRNAALARLGRSDEFDDELSALARGAVPDAPPEAYIEHADLDSAFGDGGLVGVLLERAKARRPLAPNDAHQLTMVEAFAQIRRGNFRDGRRLLSAAPQTQTTYVGAEAMLLLATAYVECAEGAESAAASAARAVEFARHQNAVALVRIGELLGAVAGGGKRLGEQIELLASLAPWHLTYAAELVANHVDLIPGESADQLRSVVEAFPARWRSAFRQVLSTATGARAFVAARLLEEIGEAPDIVLLRAMARSTAARGSDRTLGKSLLRRLAVRIYVEDQGRVTVTAGSRVIPGSRVRRKVLALLCFLLSRPGSSATRDQVLDALWPDLAPDVATNSLNQTVYFLRRVFEEKYVEDLSPGYLVHDSELIWLDRELVTSRSIQCTALIRAMPTNPEPDDVESLSVLYRGRFALDFEYEEWADHYRDSMHASYLEIVERAVRLDLEHGHFDRGIRLARRALEVDPTAVQIEQSLLRLYQATGAHAAAAEQYEHYSTMLREELGIEPPPLESMSDR